MARQIQERQCAGGARCRQNRYVLRTLEQNGVELAGTFDDLFEIEAGGEPERLGDVRSVVFVHDEHALTGSGESASDIRHARRCAHAARARHDCDRACPRERENLPQALGLIAGVANQVPPPRAFLS